LRPLSRTDPIAYLEGVGLALKLCAAVQDLAALQIVHRDLSENILLLPDGEIKLLDLGSPTCPASTSPTTIVWRHHPLHGARAVRKQPAINVPSIFAGSDGLSPVLRRPVSIRPARNHPAAKVTSRLPAWLGQCLIGAMEKNREKRFKDASEFARALENGLSQGAARPLGTLPPQHRGSIRCGFGKTHISVCRSVFRSADRVGCACDDRHATQAPECECARMKTFRTAAPNCRHRNMACGTRSPPLKGQFCAGCGGFSDY